MNGKNQGGYKDVDKKKEEKKPKGHNINHFWNEIKERKLNERRAGASVVMMMKKMMKGRTDRDRALCVSHQ